MKEFFNGIKTLRSLLQDEKKLQVIHTTKIWEASFIWNQPATREEVAEIEKAMGKKLPEDFIIFLTTISDGALLYYDEDFCQWGYRIFGIQEILEMQRNCENYYEEDWSPDFIAIGEIVGDRNAIISNIANPLLDDSGCELIEGDRIDHVDNWPKMCRSFHEWTDILVAAQGTKFWDWYRLIL